MSCSSKVFTLTAANPPDDLYADQALGEPQLGSGYATTAWWQSDAYGAATEAAPAAAHISAVIC
jgi:hypothetical protein